MVEYDVVQERESRDDCSLRQNPQNESNFSEESDKKRHKVVSQKEKLLADILRGREERLQILKRMAEKQKKKQSLIILFLHSSKVWHKLLRSSLPV